MKITISPTRQVDLSLGLRNALTKKACENVVQGVGNEAGTKRVRGGRETGKGGERQKTEGKGEGKNRAQSPFLPHPFYGRLEGLHEGSIRKELFMKRSNETSRV